MRNTNITVLAVAVMAGFIGGVFAVRVFPQKVAAAESEVVRATRFELVNSSGKVDAYLGRDANGNVAIAFLGPEGRVRVELGLWSDMEGHLLRFLDKEGRSRLRFLAPNS